MAPAGPYAYGLAARSKQITMPAPHHTVFLQARSQMPFLLRNQQRQSTKGNKKEWSNEAKKAKYRDAQKIIL